MHAMGTDSVPSASAISESITEKYSARSSISSTGLLSCCATLSNSAMDAKATVTCRRSMFATVVGSPALHDGRAAVLRQRTAVG